MDCGKSVPTREDGVITFASTCRSLETDKVEIAFNYERLSYVSVSALPLDDLNQASVFHRRQYNPRYPVGALKRGDRDLAGDGMHRFVINHIDYRNYVRLPNTF
jgi:hypothetical protein